MRSPGPARRAAPARIGSGQGEPRAASTSTCRCDARAVGDDRSVRSSVDALQAHPDVAAARPFDPGRVEPGRRARHVRRRRGRGRHRPHRRDRTVLLHRRRGDAQLRDRGRRRPQLPPARQPRPAAGRDRRLPGLAVPQARADRAARDLHARQLRDEAAARRSRDRHHAAARPRGDPPDRPAHRAALPALPPGRGALHAVDAGDPARGLPPHPRAAGAAGAGAAAAGRARARGARAGDRRRGQRGAGARARARASSSGCSDVRRRRRRTGSAGARRR